MDVLAATADFLWEWPLLIVMPGIGIYMTARLRALQFRKLRAALRAVLTRDESASSEDGAPQGDMSPFQALMTALASCVGAGNVVGVAAAIAGGGPGAVFWMWMTGILGMATKYTEALLGVKYRVWDDKGNVLGGPMQYLPKAVPGQAGQALAAAYAMFTLGASLDMVQPSGIADAMNSAPFGVPPFATAIVLTVLVAAVVVGGVRSISRAAQFLVPFMLVSYVGTGLVVLAINIRGMPDMLRSIFSGAFTREAARGYFAGASVQSAVRLGLARGVFSNEAGLGLSAIAAAAARTTHPARQAMVNMLQVFIDTLVVCSVTAFAILASGSWWEHQDPKTGEALRGAPLTIKAFNTGMPTDWLGGVVVTISLALFVFTSILAWYYFGERAAIFLFGTRAVPYYRLAHLSSVFVGAFITGVRGVDAFKLAWSVVDIMNGSLGLLNVVGLACLSPVVIRETRDFFKGDSRACPCSPASVELGSPPPAREFQSEQGPVRDFHKLVEVREGVAAAPSSTG